MYVQNIVYIRLATLSYLVFPFIVYTANSSMSLVDDKFSTKAADLAPPLITSTLVNLVVLSQKK